MSRLEIPSLGLDRKFAPSHPLFGCDSLLSPGAGSPGLFSRGSGGGSAAGSASAANPWDALGLLGAAATPRREEGGVSPDVLAWIDRVVAASNGPLAASPVAAADVTAEPAAAAAPATVVASPVVAEPVADPILAKQVAGRKRSCGGGAAAVSVEPTQQKKTKSKAAQRREAFKQAHEEDLEELQRNVTAEKARGSYPIILELLKLRSAGKELFEKYAQLMFGVARKLPAETRVEMIDHVVSCQNAQLVKGLLNTGLLLTWFQSAEREQKFKHACRLLGRDETKALFGEKNFRDHEVAVRPLLTALQNYLKSPELLPKQIEQINCRFSVLRKRCPAAVKRILDKPGSDLQRRFAAQ
jgi:TfoX/Sxy family transcriptional regulator of competence genes